MESPGRIGKYTILETLGKGAMGIVYKGFDPGVERHVALKIIRKELLGHERAGEIVQRFRNEAQAGGRLQHPGIVSVYEYGEDEKTAFIAMEFVEGRALSQYIALKVRFERATERLMPYVGPVAGVLAERVSMRAPDRRTHYHWLAEHIENVDEQMDFLAGR